MIVQLFVQYIVQVLCLCLRVLAFEFHEVSGPVLPSKLHVIGIVTSVCISIYCETSLKRMELLTTTKSYHYARVILFHRTGRLPSDDDEPSMFCFGRRIT